MFDWKKGECYKNGIRKKFKVPNKYAQFCQRYYNADKDAALTTIRDIIDELSKLIKS